MMGETATRSDRGLEVRENGERRREEDAEGKRQSKAAMKHCPPFGYDSLGAEFVRWSVVDALRGV